MKLFIVVVAKKSQYNKKDENDKNLSSLKILKYIRQCNSFQSSFAKLVTKILANRLAGRLDEMVSPN